MSSAAPAQRISPLQRHLFVRQPTRRALRWALIGFAAIGLVVLAFFVGAALPEGYSDAQRRRPQVVFGGLSEAQRIAEVGLAPAAGAPIIAQGQRFTFHWSSRFTASGPWRSVTSL